MISRGDVGALFGILDGATRGAYTLPATLIAAGECYSRVQQMRAAVVAPPAPLQVLQDVAVSFAAGADLDVDRVNDAREQLRRYDDTANVMDVALDVAANILGVEVRDHGDEIITDHLAIAQAEIIDRVRELAPQFTKHGMTRDALFRAPGKARAAFDAVSDLAVRFSLVRQAREHVLKLTGAPTEPDYRGYFALIRNAEKVRPDILLKPAADTPWPNDAIGSLVWFAQQPGVELWCPTASQQAERWHEVFPINRHLLVGVE